jgi:DNA-directed RNA polymerase subunit RPC12/RpoP
MDTDSDGVGDNSDADLDNDGFLNSQDDFPTISTEWQDSDSDGIGDNSDPDDDNDGVVDWEDYYPYDKNENLEPFWWWWVLMAVLVLLLIFVIFITNQRPRDYLGPEEEYESKYSSVFTKKPKRRSPSQPKRRTAPELFEKKTAEPKEEEIEPISEVTSLSELESLQEESYDEDLEGKPMQAEEIECPACGMTFMVEIGDLPTEIKCPYCGVTGALD